MTKKKRQRQSMTPETAHAPFLVGARLYLRPLDIEDLDRCQRWINDPETRRFIMNRFPVARCAERQWLERRGEGGSYPADIGLAIVLRDGDRHIGNIGLHQIDWVDRSGMTGMVIGEARCRNKGYGHEAKELLLAYAFDTLHLHRVSSGVLDFNQRSLRCLLKSGYVIEGRRREAHFREGRWIDHVDLGLLASEWRARRGP